MTDELLQRRNTKNGIYIGWKKKLEKNSIFITKNKYFRAFDKKIKNIIL